MIDIRSIAGGAIRQAVHDLEGVYDKLRLWDELLEKGELKAYVKKMVRQNNLGALTLTTTDATAIDLFNEGEDANDKHHLLFGVTGVEGLPGSVREQKAYIEQNHKRLREKIKPLVKAARRELQDEKEGII